MFCPTAHTTPKKRAKNSVFYRFNFNGQERDDEVYGAGNAYSFEYRVHDPRLGRFLSVDPLYRDYPWNSTYAFAENDVIRCKDLEGLERVIMTGKVNSKSSACLEIVRNSDVLLDMTYRRPDAVERGQSDLIIITTGDINAPGWNKMGHTIDISGYAKYLYNNRNSSGRDLAINQKKKEYKQYLSLKGFKDTEILEQTTAKHVYAIIIDQTFFSKASPAEILGVAMHEFIAHYAEKAKTGDGGIQDHLKFFGIDPENPYKDKFYSKSEIDGILGKNDTKSSISPSKYKPGSTARKIADAIDSSIKELKERNTDKKSE